MEIFQTIWTALTTQNVELTKLLLFPFHFLEGFVFMLLITSILNVIISRKRKLLYAFALSLCSILTRYIIPAPYNTFINMCLFLLSNIYILKIGILKSILGLLIPFIITIVYESFASKIYYFIFNINYADGMNIPIHRIIGNIFMYLYILCIYYILKYFKFTFSKLEIRNSRKKHLLIITTIFAMVLIATQLYIITFYANVLPFFIIIISVISLLTYILISLYTTYTVSKLETTSISLEESQLYNKTLEILQDNTKAFRHDFSNILIGMIGYMDKNDMEGLKKYHNQLLEDIKQVNNLTTLNPKVVNNPGVYNILASKYHKADNLGIKINLEVFLDLNDLDMKIYEFTRILGILMDNAIEATSECEEKIVNVSIRKNSRKHMQLLVIENTYKNKDIDTEKIYEKGYSTKPNNTGLGLWEVRQILKKNNNLNLFTSKNNKYFSQQLEIYY